MFFNNVSFYIEIPLAHSTFITKTNKFKWVSKLTTKKYRSQKGDTKTKKRKKIRQISVLKRKLRQNNLWFDGIFCFVFIFVSTFLAELENNFRPSSAGQAGENQADLVSLVLGNLTLLLRSESAGERSKSRIFRIFEKCREKPPKMFREGEDVLMRAPDGLLYLGVLVEIDEGKKLCFHEFLFNFSFCWFFPSNQRGI